MAAGQFETLEEFMDWWLRKRPLRVPLDCVHKYPGVTTVTLYRRKQYQVQMVSVDPNQNVKEHCHPNVDTYEVGILRVPKEEYGYVAIGDIEHTCPSKPILIAHGVMHGGKAGASGGGFLSFQKWLNDVPPTCIGLDSGDAGKGDSWCVEEN
jgi:hypothetical protein